MQKICRHYIVQGIFDFRDMFLYTWTDWKTPLEIHFMCLGTKETYRIYVICYIVFVLCSKKCCLFHNFLLFCSNNIQFFINHALKLEKPSRYVKGSCMFYVNCLVTNSNIQILAHLLRKMLTFYELRKVTYEVHSILWWTHDHYAACLKKCIKYICWLNI